MPSIFTTIRQGLQQNIKTVAPFSTTPSQVVLGNYDWAAGTDFFANIVTTGPWIYISPTRGHSSGREYNAEFELYVDLMYGYVGNAAYDFTTIEDIMGAVLNTIVSYSKFVTGGSQGYYDLKWGLPEIRTDLTPIVARTRFSMEFKFVADQI